MDLNSLGIAKPESQTRVCVAMSGGVDSSAAAVLLRNQGYNVFGATMDLLQPPYLPPLSSIADARKVADKLGIEHHYLDLRQQFSQKVIDYFADSYLQGQTPSPCIMCNRHIKLGILADFARENGADILVTGHYAGIKLSAQGVELHRGEDANRDQSYFLFAVKKRDLQMLRCPLATFCKEKTREIAREAGLEIYKKADSQDICFVASGHYADLIAKLRPEAPFRSGKIVDSSGKVLGQHRGLIHYTVGQRRGMGIGGGDILYVLKLDVPNNRLIVGSKNELLTTNVHIRNLNWLGDKLPETMLLDVKLRSRQKAIKAKVRFNPADNSADLKLLEDFYGAAPGQGACFYDGTRVMGGGIITELTNL